MTLMSGTSVGKRTFTYVIPLSFIPNRSLGERIGVYGQPRPFRDTVLALPLRRLRS